MAETTTRAKSSNGVADFQRAILQIRNILRPMAITGMDSMRTICLYLAARYLERDVAAKAGIPDLLCWDSLMETLKHNGGVSYVMSDFYLSGSDTCLVKRFDRLFGTQDFPFGVEDSRKHAEILKILDPIDLKRVTCDIDLLGWIYEEHLKTGASSARDLGQYFTDRSVCRYMVGLCAPGLKEGGAPETICDPAMGTGGFLASYLDYYKTHFPGAVKWDEHQAAVGGADSDPKVAAFARINLFIESGAVRFENLTTQDSLKSGLPASYDIVLANMPFGVKGIKHDECCEAIRELGIKATKSEPLFLQLIMKSLKEGGRCAVVVPDGILVNSDAASVKTRKRLLTQFELRKVVKMKGKFFMNTGIQPSILFFANSGYSTGEVEFCELEKGEDGNAVETRTSVVQIEQIDRKLCSLDARRYLPAEKMAESRWPGTKLGDLLNKVAIKQITLEDARAGQVPLYSASVKIHSHNEAYYSELPCIIQACVGSNLTHCVHFAETAFAATGNLWVLRPQTLDINLKYIFYFLRLTEIVATRIGISVKPKINLSDFFQLEVVHPPLTIQNQIVATLDRLFPPDSPDLNDVIKLTNRAMELVLIDPTGKLLEPVVAGVSLVRKLKDVANDIRGQMKAIADAASRKGTIKTVGESCALKCGFAFKSADYSASGVRVLTHKNFENGILVPAEKQSCLPAEMIDEVYQIHPGDVLISMDFDCGKTAIARDEKWALNQRILKVRTKLEEKLSQEYLYWLLLLGPFYEEMQLVCRGTIIKHISAKDVEDVKISIPPIEFQRDILARLEAQQSQVEALEAQAIQCEVNARFILESYLA